jgi:predicted ATPase
MIKSVRLKNFKSYKDSGEVPFAPFTVLIGCNNAGKSSLLQSLLVLRQTLLDPSIDTRLVTRGRHVDLGGFYDIVHGKESTNDEDRRFTIEVARDPVGIKFSENSDHREATRLSLTFGFTKRTNKIRISSARFFDDKGCVLSCNETGWKSDGVDEATKKSIKFRLRNFLPSASIESSEIKKTSLKMSEKLVSTMMSVSMQSHPWTRLFLNDIVHIAPLRSHVPFYSGLGERVSTEAGSGDELLRVLANKAPLPTSKKPLTESLNYWMDDRFQALSNIRLKMLDNIGHVRSLIADDPHGQKNVNVAMMGEGISQILPISATALRSHRDDVLLIEQPEIHLHPKLQADLADLFISVVNVGKRQIVVETHSEHFLLRLRRRIAEGIIKDPNDVAILFVEKHGGESRVRRLRINGSGHFDDWPDGFFDDAYREAMALALAQPVKR